MARLVRRTEETHAHPRAVGEVVITTIAELPVGVSVSVWTFAPGSEVKLGPSYDDAGWTVLSGTGWVDSEESGRQDLAPGTTAYVPVEDTPTFGSDEGMAIVHVFGGLMMPR
jgi:quercetin dioxygenase-like cupin family protein